jgi:hypothetical protein
MYKVTLIHAYHSRIGEVAAQEPYAVLALDPKSVLVIWSLRNN